MAQDREDETHLGQWEDQRIQEDLGALHQLRQIEEASENQLGDAPVPPWFSGGRERRRVGGVQSLLSDAAETVRCFRTSYQRLLQVEAFRREHQRGCFDGGLLQQNCRVDTAIYEGIGTGSSSSEPAPPELRFPSYSRSDF